MTNRRSESFAGFLKSVQTKAPMASIRTEFTHSPKSWSNNKLVLDKVLLTSKSGSTIVTSSNLIEYLSVNGIGFPSKITIKNVAETIIPAHDKEKEKKVKNETGTIVRFTKYEVNTGKAQKSINQ